MITNYNKSGLLHSYNDQPSLVNLEGNQFWHINGKLERNGDLPCAEFINGDQKYNLENGNYKIKIVVKIYDELCIKYYNSDNKIHRLNNPSIFCYKNNKKYFAAYYNNGKLFRLDGPAFIYYYNDGKVAQET